MNFEKAVKQAKEESPERNFEETVELILNFKEVDFTKPEERVNRQVALPNGRGKKIKVAVIAGGETADIARKNADIVLGKDDVEDLGEDKRKARKIINGHDHFIAEAPLMAQIGKTLGPLMGPRNKMPEVIAPGQDPTDKIKDLRNVIKVKSKGKFMPTLQVPVGTRNMEDAELAENAERVYDAIKNELPKRQENINKVYVKTTMGPTVKVEDE